MCRSRGFQVHFFHKNFWNLWCSTDEFMADVWACKQKDWGCSRQWQPKALSSAPSQPSNGEEQEAQVPPEPKAWFMQPTAHSAWLAVSCRCVTRAQLHDNLVFKSMLQTQISLIGVERFPTLICPEIPQQNAPYFLSWLFSSGVICHKLILWKTSLRDIQALPGFCCPFPTTLWAHARHMDECT